MITRVLEEIAATSPWRLAVVDGGVSIDYGELVRRSRLLAGYLRKRLQVGEGSIVAAAMSNRWEYPVAFFAAARLGAILMPFNPQWRAAEIGWFLERFRISGVVTAGNLGGLAGDRILNVDGEEMARLWREPGDGEPLSGEDFGEREALYLSTSGSTGRPKVAPRTQRNLLAGRSAVGEALRVRAGQRFLSVVPFHHANGFANCLFLPLMSGATVVMARTGLPGALAESVRRERVEVVIGSPVLYGLLAEHVRRVEDFGSVETYISSGAALPAEVGARWRERFGKPIRQLYGSSETGTIAIEGAEGAAAAGSAGRVLPTVRVRTLGSDGTVLPPGQSGEIAVQSPAMMAGYVGEEELNRAAFAGGFFRMGDVGRLTEEGELILEGRLKRWVNCGGVKVDPAEVERALRELDSVEQCWVGPGVEAGLEVLTARIVLRAGETPSRQKIVEHCRKRMAEYKIPRVIEFVDAMPADLAGKAAMEWIKR